MTETSTPNGNAKKKPDYVAFAVRSQGDNAGPKYTRIGVGFKYKNGSIGVMYDAIPLSGHIVLTELDAAKPSAISYGHPSRKPDFLASMAREIDPNKSYWTDVGVAYRQDGYLSVFLDVVPPSKVVLSVPREARLTATSTGAAAAPPHSERNRTMTQTHTINPFFHAAAIPVAALLPAEPRPQPENIAHKNRPLIPDYAKPRFAKLPQAPITGSLVPGLTSLYADDEPGPYGNRGYPGNCGGNLIRDLLQFYAAKAVFDPMTGSGTCQDVCKELGIYCWSGDIRTGFNAADPRAEFPRGCFDFAWIHPPYWRQKLYTDHPGDLSRAEEFSSFINLYHGVLLNCLNSLKPGGKLAVLMGDYHDRKEGFVPLTYHTKRLCFFIGMKQCATDIIRFSHGASSGRKVYTSSFIPGLHDVCMIFEKTN